MFMWDHRAPGLTLLSGDGLRHDSAVRAAVSCVTVLGWRDDRLIWVWLGSTAGYIAVLPAGFWVVGVTPGTPLVVGIPAVVII